MAHVRMCDRCSQPLIVGTDSQLIELPSEDVIVLWRCSRCHEEFVE